MDMACSGQREIDEAPRGTHHGQWRWFVRCTIPLIGFKPCAVVKAGEGHGARPRARLIHLNDGLGYVPWSEYDTGSRRRHRALPAI